MSPTTVTQTLTSPQFAAITDFTDLHLEFKANVASGAYVGPGDIVSGAVVFWSLRAYTLASIGTNAVRLRRDSDNTEQDFVTIAGGGLDLAAIATFKGSAGLWFTKIYDQTGNGHDVVQATAANQPQFATSIFGSLPSAFYLNPSTAACYMPCATSFTFTQPLTALCFMQPLGGGGGSYPGYREMMGSLGGGGLGFRVNPSTGTPNLQVLSDFIANIGTSTGTVADGANAAVAVSLDINGGNFAFYINGSASGSGVVLQTLSTGVNQSLGGPTVSTFYGYMPEFIEYSSILNATQVANISNNQITYWLPYLGPGDIISGAAVYCGLRAYSSATIGNNVVTIRRSSDNSQKTFVSLSNGGINTADAFFDGSTYTVVTLYDQTGNGNDLNQSTAGLQPLFLLSGGSGGHPCMQFINSNSHVLAKATGATSLGNQPNSGSLVFNNTGGVGNASNWAVNDGGGGNSAYNVFGVDSPSAGEVYLYAGTVFPITCSTSAWHAAQGLFNSSSSILMLDGTSNTGGAAGSQPGGFGQLVMGNAQSNPASSTPYNGLIAEALFWHGDQSASFSALTSNQRAYWGF